MGSLATVQERRLGGYTAVLVKYMVQTNSRTNPKPATPSRTCIHKGLALVCIVANFEVSPSQRLSSALSC